MIKVEIGSRSLKEPFSQRSIVSIIGEEFSSRSFADTAIEIPCVNPERTYLEKLFLLHEEFQKPKEKIRVNRLSRHLYDIMKISQKTYKTKAFQTDLIQSIVAHRERFNGMKGVDYTSHSPPNLRPVPPNEYIEAWEVDYHRMQEQMIHGASPVFEDLMAVIEQAVGEFNALK